MRPGTTIALGAILAALFTAVIIQFVVLDQGADACDEGTITAEGSPGFVLPVPDRGLGDQVGRTVTGCRVRVESIAGVGFWVGQPANRVFVDLVEGSGPFVPDVGARLALAGTLAPVGPEQLAGLPEADRSALTSQNAYVSASRVTPTG